MLFISKRERLHRRGRATQNSSHLGRDVERGIGYEAIATIASFKLIFPTSKAATFNSFAETFPWNGHGDKRVSATVNIIISR